MDNGSTTSGNDSASERCDSGLTKSLSPDQRSSPESPISKKQSRFLVTHVSNHQHNLGRHPNVPKVQNTLLNLKTPDQRSSPESPVSKKNSRFLVTRVLNHQQVQPKHSPSTKIHETPHAQKPIDKKSRFIVTPARENIGQPKAESSIKVLYMANNTPSSPQKRPYVMTKSFCSRAPPSAQIHNKIEQALDLVKSHLTLAVRQEVDTMKKTISQLEIKVASLEAENKMLRQHADVLQSIIRRC